MQTQIDFTHKKENNSESQANLDQNRERFNGHCKTVLEYLNKGYRITQKFITDNTNVTSFPTRIYELKKAGIPIKSEWIEIQVDEIHTSKVKVYFIEK